MEKKNISFFEMIRAPFLSSIISPILIGTLVAYYIGREFEFINFIIVFILSIFFHIATNVYNDIYDTLQGTDAINLNRNDFSGGSGVIVKDPSSLPLMYRIARFALVGALLASIILFFRIQDNLKSILIILAGLSAFFSKFYTAAPLKLAYRGWGELSVWFAFGPMAIAAAVISQNVNLNSIVFATMPITGISTLSILLIGQIIDFDADKEAGKWGVAVRCGKKFTGILFLLVQIILCVNIIVLSIIFLDHHWLIMLSLVPYLILLPNLIKILVVHFNNIELLKTAAQQNVLLHLIFSLLFVITLLISVLLR